jgi:hypothetical protein
MLLTNVFSGVLDTAHSYAGSFTWEPAVRFSRSTVLNMLMRVEVGQIVVRDVNGQVAICGSSKPKDGSLRVEQQVKKEAFWVWLLLFADMVRAAYCKTRHCLAPHGGPER